MGPASRFCFACHRADRFPVFKVHDSEHRSEQCLFCHLETPVMGEGEQRFALRAKAEQTCLVCHEKRDHPGDKDHLRSWEALPDGALGRLIPRDSNKEALQMQQGNSLWILPLQTGRAIGCTTCHDPHRTARHSPYLLRMPSRAWLCRCCHAAPGERRPQ